MLVLATIQWSVFIVHGMHNFARLAKPDLKGCDPAKLNFHNTINMKQLIYIFLMVKSASIVNSKPQQGFDLGDTKGQ